MAQNPSETQADLKRINEQLFEEAAARPAVFPDNREIGPDHGDKPCFAQNGSCTTFLIYPDRIEKIIPNPSEIQALFEKINKQLFGTAGSVIFPGNRWVGPDYEDEPYFAQPVAPHSRVLSFDFAKRVRDEALVAETSTIEPVVQSISASSSAVAIDGQPGLENDEEPPELEDDADVPATALTSQSRPSTV